MNRYLNNSPYRSKAAGCTKHHFQVLGTTTLKPNSDMVFNKKCI